MGRTQNVDRLSGTVADGGFTAITTYPTLAVMHTVPAGETHEVWVIVSNNNSGGPVELIGEFGGDADAFNHDMVAEKTETIIKGAVLVGPCTVEMGATGSATNVHFTGKVIVHKYA